jgi:putative transposase
VRAHKLIVTEDLAPSTMPASAKGREEKPGRNVKEKAGPNRAILDATPGVPDDAAHQSGKKLGASSSS